MPEDISDSYQLNIIGDGTLVFSEEPYSYYLHPHTWRRNGNNFGISCDSMWNAQSPSWTYIPDLKHWPKCYGDYPPTIAQIDSLIWATSKLLRFYKLPAAAIMTHTDFAILDNYGPNSGDPETKWDWWKEGKLLKKKIIEEYIRTKPIIKKAV